MLNEDDIQASNCRGNTQYTVKSGNNLCHDNLPICQHRDLGQIRIIERGGSTRHREGSRSCSLREIQEVFFLCGEILD